MCIRDRVKPIAKDYRGYTLHEIPPNGQGIAALIALGILGHFDVAGLPVDGVDSQHLQIEAMKLALADLQRVVAEDVGDRLVEVSLLAFAQVAAERRREPLGERR